MPKAPVNPPEPAKGSSVTPPDAGEAGGGGPAVPERSEGRGLPLPKATVNPHPPKEVRQRRPTPAKPGEAAPQAVSVTKWSEGPRTTRAEGTSEPEAAPQALSEAKGRGLHVPKAPGEPDPRAFLFGPW